MSVLVSTTDTLTTDFAVLEPVYTVVNFLADDRATPSEPLVLTQLEGALAEGMVRLIERATNAGADGLIGVHLHPLGNLTMQAVLMGTAVRLTPRASCADQNAARQEQKQRLGSGGGDTSWLAWHS